MEQSIRAYLHLCKKHPHMFVDMAFCNTQGPCILCIPKPFFDNERENITMALTSSVISGKGISEELFLSEIKKLSDLILNQKTDMLKMISISDERIKALSDEIKTLKTMLQRPNVFTPETLTKQTPQGAKSSVLSGFVLDLDEILAKVSDKAKGGVKQFIADFRTKHKLPMAENEAEKAIGELWKTKTTGKGVNGYWHMASNKTITAILVKAFCGNQSDDKPVVLDKTKTEYWTTAFAPQLTEQNLSDTAQWIEDNVDNTDITTLKGNRYFTSAAKTAIVSRFGDKRLDQIYPANEIAEFLQFLMQFVPDDK